MDGIRIGGLWKNKTKDGKSYLSGNFGTCRILVFPNEKKEKESQPDFSIHLVENKPKENGGKASSGDDEWN